MRSGNLKHKITFQSYSETQNDFGETIKGWSDVFSCYASIVPLQGKEYFASSGVKADITHKIECRYKQGIKPSMRIVYGDRFFDINSVINIREANKTLQIMASEVVDG